MYLSLHCHHENDSCIKMGSDESHNFGRERTAEADSNRGPSAYQPNALSLDQTGSQVCDISLVSLVTAHNFYGNTNITIHSKPSGTLCVLPWVEASLIRQSLEEGRVGKRGLGMVGVV